MTQKWRQISDSSSAADVPTPMVKIQISEKDSLLEKAAMDLHRRLNDRSGAKWVNYSRVTDNCWAFSSFITGALPVSWRLLQRRKSVSKTRTERERIPKSPTGSWRWLKFCHHPGCSIRWKAHFQDTKREKFFFSNFKFFIIYVLCLPDKKTLFSYCWKAELRIICRFIAAVLVWWQTGEIHGNFCSFLPI